MARKKTGDEEYKVKNRKTGRTMRTFSGPTGYRDAKRFLNRLDKPKNHMVEWTMDGGRVKRRYGFQLDYFSLESDTSLDSSVKLDSFQSDTSTNTNTVFIEPESTTETSTTTTTSPTSPTYSTTTSSETTTETNDSIVNPTSNSNTIEQNTQQMVDSAEDTNWWPVVGAVGAIGLVGAGVAMTNNDDDKKPKRRRRNRTKEEARKAFASDYKSLVKKSASSDLDALLQIDFAKQGPLYRAYKDDRLRLNPNRDGWVIQKKDGMFYPYDRANFGKERGFSVLPVEAEQYVYSTGGFVLPRAQFEQRVKSGVYTNARKAGPGQVEFVDERGNTIVANAGTKDQYVPEFKNTISGYFNRTPYDPKSAKAAKDKEDVSDAVKQALAKVQALEAKRAASDETVLTPEEYLASLGAASTKSGKSALEKQKKAEEAIKKQAEEREKRAKEAETLRKQAERERVLKLNENLGKKVADSAVDQERYKYESNYVDLYVKSNLGNTIPEGSIVDASYLYSPSGQKLVITYSDEHAARIGLPVGFNKQEFTRETLIQLGVIPSQFGPSFTPIFSTGISPSYPDSVLTGPSVKTGNETSSSSARLGFMPAGATTIAAGDARKKQTGLNAFAPGVGGGARLFTRKVESKNCGCGQTPCRTYGKRVYKRNIKSKSFIGANRTLPKSSAQIIAHKARERGMTARTIPAKGGYRVYLGPMRKGG